MLNILNDSLISAISLDGTRRALTLPEVFSDLTCGTIVSFPSLRPHQRHPWHAFLVQLGVLALHRAGRAEPSEHPDAWRADLRALTRRWPDDEPWSLVVSDASKPAFMQAPAPNGELSKFKDGPETPDALDMLVTSKAHDLKGERMFLAQPEDWLFALVSLQTQEGNMGSGNYGITRMNGGYGSRSGLGLAPPGGAGRRFRRDLERLHSVVSDHGVFPEALDRSGEGLALLWCEPWDGESQISFARLDPLFIEICRRVRLVEHQGRLRAQVAGSKGTRIAAGSDLKGNTGDPWMPVERGSAMAFSIAGNGFGYRKLVELLNPEKYERPVLAKAAGNDAVEGLALVATGVCRGKGKTEGYHERHIPIPGKARTFFGTPDQQDVLAVAARERVETLADVRAALRAGLFIVAQGGPEKADMKASTSEAYASPWLDRFESEADRTFFEDLWAELGEDLPETRERIILDWRKDKKKAAERLLDAAWNALPLASTKRYRARVRADRAFSGILRKSSRYGQIFAEAAQKAAGDEGDEAS